MDFGIRILNWRNRFALSLNKIRQNTLNPKSPIQNLKCEL
ncbi:hypothetical protein D1AOALGA4SA_6068 [Olavius algarvensis Delta 1 endosymbiont]|nr:hypothetical protein D1AOALGA4SA_6068 [Olavius algarvensis Delta 1 endosymbiont]